jgi:hypothetical protein
MASKTSLIWRAEDFLASAIVLASTNHIDNAIYNAGYALEYYLKAIICIKGDFPFYPDNDRKYKEHRTDRLMSFAGISDKLKTQCGKCAGFQINWSIASKWEPSIRYEQPGTHTLQMWEDFYKALTDPDTGVITWLKSFI